jgi:septum formation protein
MLFLASQSPRRRELLHQIGLDFEILDVAVPEVRLPGEPPEDYVRRVAREKAGAGLLAVAGVPGAIVLGADTEVVFDDEVFGKPADANEAARMLGQLAGRVHRVLSAVAVVSAAREWQVLSESQVHMMPLDPAAIAAYVAGGEWRGKAGGYAIQGLAAAFVSRIEGSYSGVMGLPLHQTARLLGAAGLAVSPAFMPGP